MVRTRPTRPIMVPALLGSLMMACGCVQHRTAVNPPLPAAPPPAGEPAVTTQLIAGATVVSEPRQPLTHASPLPIDLPVSVWRRDSDGTLSRGELRVTTARPWWQRFPADIVSDLVPVEAEVFASGTAGLTRVEVVDRAQLFAAAERDGYARRDDPSKKPAKRDDSRDAKVRPTP
jgi:hypothetical protein